MHETVTNAVDIIGDALADLADAGCDPLDRAAALIAAGLGEIQEVDDLGGALAVYRMLLEHVCATLQDLDVAAGAIRH
jgi:hypothetical protein